MKKIIVTVICMLLLPLSAATAQAEEISYDLSGVYNCLSDEAKEHMLSLGADSADVNTLSGLSFESILSEIGKIAAQNADSPCKGLISATAMLLICSMLSVYKGSLNSDLHSVLDITLSLCLCASAALPAAEMIVSAGEVLTNASNLMLAFVPVSAMLMTAAGSVAGSAAHYAAVLWLGEAVLQLSSRVVIPMMQMLLGLSVACGISNDVPFGGFIKTLSKTSRWILGFLMGIFSATLGLKQVLSGSIDSITGRAAKFAVSSFVPVVGSALGEALKTIHSSVSLLKSGVGVFVILALAVTFLPLLLRTLLWLMTLWLAKSTAEALRLPQGAGLLGAVSEVFSTLLALLLCVMTVYIISAAMVFAIGGAVV